MLVSDSTTVLFIISFISAHFYYCSLQNTRCMLMALTTLILPKAAGLTLKMLRDLLFAYQMLSILISEYCVLVMKPRIKVMN